MHLSLSARATPCRTVSGAPIAAKAMKPPATVVPHLRRWQIAIDALWLEWTEMPIATLTAALPVPRSAAAPPRGRPAAPVKLVRDQFVTEAGKTVNMHGLSWFGCAASLGCSHSV